MSASSDQHFQEWVQARGVIGAADTNLDAIRKLGISLVTTLLTINAFLLPGDIGGTSALPESLKFGVLLVTLLLLGAVAVIDRNYQVLQQAAASRAMVLETELDLELTEIISQRYATKHVGVIFHLIYVMIGGALIILGYFVLYPSFWFWILCAVWITWSVLVLLISVNLVTRGGADWSLDATDVTPGQPVHLMVTNIFSGVRPELIPGHPGPLYVWLKARSERKHTFTMRASGVYWEIREASAPDNSDPLRKGVVDSDVILSPQQTFVWAIDTTHFRSPMVLKVLPKQPRNDDEGVTTWSAWPYPLYRKIRINPKSAETSSPGPQTVLSAD